MSIDTVYQENRALEAEIERLTAELASRRRKDEGCIRALTKVIAENTDRADEIEQLRDEWTIGGEDG